MRIIYGAMVGYLWPILWRWWHAPTGMVLQQPAVPPVIQQLLLIMAAGVFASGLRDLYAALGLPGGNWPWPREIGKHAAGAA
jgi:hypothetical protein